MSSTVPCKKCGKPVRIGNYEPIGFGRLCLRCSIESARIEMQALAKLYPSCFTSDGKAVVAELRLPHLG